MTTQNISNTTLNKTVKSLSKVVKKLKERFCNTTQIKRAYDLKMVLVDWEIKCPLLTDVVNLISQTHEKQENLDDLRKACTYLHLCSGKSRKIKSDEIPNDLKEFLIYFKPQISSWDLVEDWGLSYHQGRALEYIYQSLFEYGRERGDTLKKAENVLRHHMDMLEKKRKERKKK